MCSMEFHERTADSLCASTEESPSPRFESGTASPAGSPFSLRGKDSVFAFVGPALGPPAIRCFNSGGSENHFMIAAAAGIIG